MDAPLLVAMTSELGSVLEDPIKTTVVRERRLITTWVVRKSTNAVSGTAQRIVPDVVRCSLGKKVRNDAPNIARARDDM